MKEQARESRLSRWSRRKQQTLEQTKLEDLELEPDQQDLAAQLPESIVTDDDGSIESNSDQPILTDEDMPAIDTLNSESDFSMFMSSGVTDKLRNLALKQLFKAPLFNIRDGLDEYDEDYTFFEKLGDIVTCDMKHQVEMEALKKEAEELAAQESEDTNSVITEESESGTNKAMMDKENEQMADEEDPDSFPLESDSGPNIKFEELDQAIISGLENSK